jgi:hypothetical protein
MLSAPYTVDDRAEAQRWTADSSAHDSGVVKDRAPVHRPAAR